MCKKLHSGFKKSVDLSAFLCRNDAFAFINICKIIDYDRLYFIVRKEEIGQFTKTLLKYSLKRLFAYSSSSDVLSFTSFSL